MLLVFRHIYRLMMSIFNEGEVLFDISTITIASVPIPTTIWLFGSGLMGLVGMARRKKT
jgi:hypothetical protein